MGLLHPPPPPPVAAPVFPGFEDPPPQGVHPPMMPPVFPFPGQVQEGFHPPMLLPDIPPPPPPTPEVAPPGVHPPMLLPEIPTPGELPAGLHPPHAIPDYPMPGVHPPMAVPSIPEPGEVPAGFHPPMVLPEFVPPPPPKFEYNTFPGMYPTLEDMEPLPTGTWITPSGAEIPIVNGHEAIYPPQLTEPRPQVPERDGFTFGYIHYMPLIPEKPQSVWEHEWMDSNGVLQSKMVKYDGWGMVDATKEEVQRHQEYEEYMERNGWIFQQDLWGDGDGDGESVYEGSGYERSLYDAPAPSMPSWRQFEVGLQQSGEMEVPVLPEIPGPGF
ncbi:hypothetical protein FPQ18DRAFT_328176 [Pyronema domesticum]|nr:hypothetical protein FPQ18DRAFT_328176 [Pyronema domesticum]